MTLKSGRQPASNSPRKNLVVRRPEKLWHPAIAVCAIPHPSTSDGINIRCGTLTIRIEEKGCHAS
jgi:hypothetical protein